MSSGLGCALEFGGTASQPPPEMRRPPPYDSLMLSSPVEDQQPMTLIQPPPPYCSAAETLEAVDSGLGKCALPKFASEKANHNHLLLHPAADTLHFLNHDHDTIVSLSLRYRVPASALRRANNITSDQLLLGRNAILIPGQYYHAGVSLSPRPVEGEKEELRKSKIRRFMTSCKVSDYALAVAYLEQAEYNLDAAKYSYHHDEACEENPWIDSKTDQVQRGDSRRGRIWAKACQLLQPR